MGCGDEKLSKYLTQTFTAHGNAMICQQVTLLGDAEWPKVADAVIEALISTCARWNGRASASLTARGGGLPIGVTPRDTVGLYEPPVVLVSAPLGAQAHANFGARCGSWKWPTSGMPNTRAGPCKR